MKDFKKLQIWQKGINIVKLSFEMETQLIILIELGLISAERIDELLFEIRQEQQMISGFSQKLQF